MKSLKVWAFALMLVTPLFAIFAHKPAPKVDAPAKVERVVQIAR